MKSQIGGRGGKTSFGEEGGKGWHRACTAGRVPEKRRNGGRLSIGFLTGKRPVLDTAKRPRGDQVSAPTGGKDPRANATSIKRPKKESGAGP